MQETKIILFILWVGNPQRLNVKRSVIKFSWLNRLGLRSRQGWLRSLNFIFGWNTLAGWRYSPTLYENINRSTLIELIWTITPAVILMLIAFPSFKLLYLMDEVSDPSMSVLAEGLGGPKLYTLNKKVNTLALISPRYAGLEGSRITIFSKFAFLHCRWFNTRVRAASRIGPHNQDVVSVIVGSLLGDSYANRRSVEGTRICYRQSSIHKDYLFWLYNFFYTRGYCTNLEPRMYTKLLKHRGKEVQHFGYEFNTFTFRSFNWLHEMFYHKGKKVINSMIEEFITPLCLAIWISSHPNSYEELKFYTDFRRKEDIDKLIPMLKNRFGLICYSISSTGKNKKSYFGIGIADESKELFKALVDPFILNWKTDTRLVKSCNYLHLKTNS